MNASLYQVYLVADRLSKLITEAGGSHGGIELRTESFPGPAYIHHHISMWLWGDAEDRETLVADLLTRIPGATLTRDDGRMTLRGEWSNGITWYLGGGEGVCERVQVGTRTVLKPDPDAPLVEVVEPVFEVRCVDPLVSA